MRPLLAVLFAATTLALAGCYTSEKLLLDPSQAATPLALGHQIAISTGDGDKPEPVDIRLGADRWYVVRDDGKDQRLLFTPMAGAAPGDQRYAFASGEGDSGGFLYGVATRRQGVVYFDLPSCDQVAAREAAAAHGVAPPVGKAAMSPVCTFTDAGSLMGALKDYADHADPKRALSHLPAAAG